MTKNLADKFAAVIFVRSQLAREICQASAFAQSKKNIVFQNVSQSPSVKSLIKYSER
jgi:hypothetical protein